MDEPVVDLGPIALGGWKESSTVNIMNGGNVAVGYLISANNAQIQDTSEIQHLDARSSSGSRPVQPEEHRLERHQGDNHNAATFRRIHRRLGALERGAFHADVLHAYLDEHAR